MPILSGQMQISSKLYSASNGNIYVLTAHCQCLNKINKGMYNTFINILTSILLRTTLNTFLFDPFKAFIRQDSEKVLM